MANVVNRATLELRTSASAEPSRYPVADWIIDPDLGPWTRPDGTLRPERYRKASGDTLAMMDAGERTAADAADLAALQAEKVLELEEEKRYALEILAIAQMTPAQVRAAIDADIAAVNAETDPRVVRNYRCTLLRQRAVESRS